MGYLVYCILGAPVVSGEPLTGVAGAALSFVEVPGLAAAASELALVESAPPVAELLAYGRVVQELHRRQAVIPMRYGAFVEGLSALQRLLTERTPRYAALLRELEGQVEMGIRVLVPDGGVTLPPGAPPVDGGQYLAGRKAYYRMRDENARQHQALLDHYVRAFAGLYGKQRTETAARDGQTVLSLYFLIPRGLIGPFKDVFRRVVETAGARALLSGPWPPYNFVTPDFPPDVGTGSGCESVQGEQR
jgi:hypothetical protein